MHKETNEKQITDNEQMLQENRVDTNVEFEGTKKEAWEYFQEADKQTTPKKKNKVPGFICLILGFALLVAGVFTVLIGNNTSALESMEPMDVYQPYIDWLYSDSYENGPEAILAVGYAQPYDEELKQRSWKDLSPHLVKELSMKVILRNISANIICR